MIAKRSGHAQQSEHGYDDHPTRDDVIDMIVEKLFGGSCFCFHDAFLK